MNRLGPVFITGVLLFLSPVAAKRKGIDDKVPFDEYDKMDKALIMSNRVLF